MKLHLPKLLLTAVLAACVTSTSWANTGWSGNEFYIGGAAAGHLDNSIVTGLEIDDGTTTIDTVDATGKTGALKFWADDKDYGDKTSAQIGEVKINSGATLEVSTNSWNNSRYFDMLTIDKLSISGDSTANISISGPAHQVNIKDISGSLGDVTVGNGSLTISAVSSTVTGKLYSNGGNVTLGNGTDNGMLTVNRVEFSDKNGGSSLSLDILSGYTLKVTGEQNTIQEATAQYKTNSFILSEWENSTTMNVFGTVLAEKAAVLTGDRGTVINIENGATLATKGLGRSNPGKKATSTINLKDGGKLVLGDMGLDYDGYVTINVSGGTIGIAADTVTIEEELNITGTVTMDTTKHSYGDTALVQGTDGGKLVLNGDLTGAGTINATGAGTIQLGAIDSNVNISAGTAGIAFTGTYSQADGTTFTAGSGTYSIAADNMDSFIIDPNGDVVDRNGNAATNGFRKGSYVAISGGTVENSFTISYDGVDYTIDDTHRTFGVGGIGFDTWYITSGSNTLSEIYAESQAANGENAGISIGAGATLNVDAAPTSAIELAGNATLNLSQGISLEASSVTKNGHTVTLDGKGSYTVRSAEDTAITIAEGWSGSVNLNSVYVTDLSISTLGKSGSSITLQGMDGSFAANSNITADVEILNTADGLYAGISITSGTADSTNTFSGKVTGSGNFVLNTDVANFTQKFTGDVSGWTGRMDVASGNHNITYTGDAATINNRQIEMRGANATANITFDHEKAATVSSEILRSNGTLNITVKNSSDEGITFTNSKIGMSSLTVEDGTKVAFSGIESLSLSQLMVDEETLLTLGANGTGTISVTSASLTAGATVNGNLDLGNATTLTYNGNNSGGVSINGDLKLGNMTLNGDVMSAISALTAGEKLTLFTLSGKLEVLDTIVGESLNAESGNLISLSTIFTNVTDEKLYLGYDMPISTLDMLNITEFDSSVYVIMVPEPTTATLSLLALAALAARRRRK